MGFSIKYSVINLKLSFSVSGTKQKSNGLASEDAASRLHLCLGIVFILLGSYLRKTNKAQTSLYKKIDKRWDLLVNDTHNKISSTLVKKLVKKPHIKTEI